MYVCTWVYTYVYMYINTCAYAYVFIYTHICTCTEEYLYIYTYTYTQCVYIYIHICIDMCRQKSPRDPSFHPGRGYFIVDRPAFQPGQGMTPTEPSWPQTLWEQGPRLHTSGLLKEAMPGPYRAPHRISPLLSGFKRLLPGWSW